MGEVHKDHFDFSREKEPYRVLSSISPLRAEAQRLIREGDLPAADQKFREIVTPTADGMYSAGHIINVRGDSDEALVPITHAVETGRAFIEWAILTETIASSTIGNARNGLIELAFYRARTGVIQLVQDQHQIVKDAELSAAQEIVNRLRNLVEQSAESKTSAPQLSIVKSVGRTSVSDTLEMVA